MGKLTKLRELISEAVWNVMHGHDGWLLTGDYYPGHHAIVDAAMEALESPAGRAALSQNTESGQ